MFKEAIQSPRLPVRSDMERVRHLSRHLPNEPARLTSNSVFNCVVQFNFAKRCIADRKKSQGTEVEESVVLAFGSGTAGVNVVRKVKRNRTLWKVEN